MMKIKWTGLLFILLCSSYSLARGVSPAPFEILTPTIGGSGCKAGSAFAFVAQADRLVRLKFGNLMAESGGTLGPLSRKNCGLVIPVQVNPGYSIALPNVELNGAAEITDEAKISLDVGIFFSGQEGPNFKKEFLQTESFQFLSQINESQWSPCGQSVNLRVSIGLLAKNTSRAGISSLKLMDGLVQPLKWKRC